MPPIGTLSRYAAIPGCVFLFILPFAHTVALRLLCLFLAASVAFYLWFRDPPPLPPCRLPFAFWAGLCWTSVLWSIEPAYSLGELINEVGYTILTFLVFYCLTKSELDWQKWRYTIVTSLCILSIYAIFNYFELGTWDIAGEVKGKLGDRNSYSTYIILTIPFLLLTVSQTGVGLSPRKLGWVGLPLALISGYLTLNRIMWPTLAVTTVVFGSLYLSKSSISGRTRVIGASAVAVLCLVFVAQFLLATYAKRSSNDATISDVQQNVKHDLRPRIWSYAEKRIRERPLTGYGYGKGILRSDFRNTFGNPRVTHAHNMILNYALEVGLAGVVALLWIFAALVQQFWILYRTANRKQWELGVFGLSLLTALTMKALTDDILVRDNALLFWAFLGMSLGLGRRLAVASAGEA